MRKIIELYYLFKNYKGEETRRTRCDHHDRKGGIYKRDEWKCITWGTAEYSISYVDPNWIGNSTTGNVYTSLAAWEAANHPTVICLFYR